MLVYQRVKTSNQHSKRNLVFFHSSLSMLSVVRWFSLPCPGTLGSLGPHQRPATSPIAGHSTRTIPLSARVTKYANALVHRCTRGKPGWRFGKLWDDTHNKHTHTAINIMNEGAGTPFKIKNKNKLKIKWVRPQHFSLWVHFIFWGA
jgi:hypothetical protein